MYVFSSVHIMSFSSEHWLNDSKGSWIWKSNKSEHLCLSCISSFSPDSNHCFSIPTAHVTTVSLSSYFTGTRDFLMWGHSSRQISFLYIHKDSTTPDLLYTSTTLWKQTSVVLSLNTKPSPWSLIITSLHNRTSIIFPIASWYGSSTLSLHSYNSSAHRPCSWKPPLLYL